MIKKERAYIVQTVIFLIESYSAPWICCVIPGLHFN